MDCLLRVLTDKELVTPLPRLAFSFQVSLSPLLFTISCTNSKKSDNKLRSLLVKLHGPWRKSFRLLKVWDFSWQFLSLQDNYQLIGKTKSSTWLLSAQFCLYGPSCMTSRDLRWTLIEFQRLNNRPRWWVKFKVNHNSCKVNHLCTDNHNSCKNSNNSCKEMFISDNLWTHLKEWRCKQDHVDFDFGFSLSVCKEFD